MYLKTIITGLLFLSLFTGVSCREGSKKNTDKMPVTLSTIKIEGGWGYEIKVDGKPFIRQDYIPVIQGKHPFRSEEDALKTGQLIVNKIKKNELPVITRDELCRLSILKDSCTTLP